MKKVILLFLILTITLYSSERVSFRATAVYETKNLIMITADKYRIDFGILLDGQVGTKYNQLTLKGTWNMELKYEVSPSKEELGLEVIEESRSVQNDEMKVIYKYTWDTSKSKRKNLEGSVIVFTAFYPE